MGNDGFNVVCEEVVDFLLDGFYRKKKGSHAPVTRTTSDSIGGGEDCEGGVTMVRTKIEDVVVTFAERNKFVGYVDAVQTASVATITMEESVLYDGWVLNTECISDPKALVKTSCISWEIFMGVCKGGAIHRSFNGIPVTS